MNRQCVREMDSAKYLEEVKVDGLALWYRTCYPREPPFTPFKMAFFRCEYEDELHKLRDVFGYAAQLPRNVLTGI